MGKLVSDKQRTRLNNLGCNIESLDNFSKQIAVSTALDFIREEYQRKGLFLAVRFNKYVNPHYFGEMEDILNNRYIATDNFDIHPLAESALLDAVLTYLEEKKNLLIM